MTSNYLKSVLENAEQGFLPSLFEINKYFTELPIKETSIVSQYSIFKGKLKKILPDDSFYSTMFLPEDIRIRVKDLNEEVRLQTKMTSIKKGIVNKFLKFEKSEDPAEQLIFLLLVSGRRLTEIDNLVLEKKSVNSIVFRGQLKLKNPQPYLVTLLKSFKVFEKVFNKFKESSIDFKTISKKSNTILKTVSGNMNLHIHDLRRMYALLSYKKFGEDRPFPLFIAEVLGHNNELSASYYQNFKIV